MTNFERVVPHWYMYPPKTAYSQSSSFDYADLQANLAGDICFYVHIPFCNMKCSFCSLFTSSGYSDDTADKYVDHLVMEISAASKILPDEGFSVPCLYFGGGTPGLLTGHALDRICDAFSKIPQTRSSNRSVEFSPDIISETKVEPWLRNNFDRISIGVQTFSDDLLQRMGRKHTAKEALIAIGSASHFGFKEVNVDLIFGHVDQTNDDWALDLKSVVESKATSCTFHPLATVEKTAFERKLSKASDKLGNLANYQRQAYEYFSRHGWVRTSAISYSKTGNANPLERAEALGASTFGFGAGSRTYLPTLHISTLPVQSRAPFGGVLNNYYDCVKAGSKPALASLEMNADEALRRSLILQLHHGEINWPTKTLEVDDATVDALRASLTNFELQGLIYREGKKFLVTDEGALSAARMGAILSSEMVKNSMAHLTVGDDAALMDLTK